MMLTGSREIAAPATVFPSATGDPERLLWEGRPSPRALVGPALWLFLFFVLVLWFGLPLYHRLAEQGARLPASTRTALSADARRYIVYVGWVLAGLVALRILFSAARVTIGLLCVRYRITNQRIVVERGLIGRSLDEIDTRTIEDSRFVQSVLQRILGIGAVVVISVDKSSPQFVIHGVLDPRKLRELIRSAAYAASKGQVFMRQT
jgi:hypothetical protein